MRTMQKILMVIVAVAAMFFFGPVRKAWRKLFGQKPSEPAKPYVETKRQAEHRKEQIDRLAALMAEANHAEAEVAYSKLFGEIGMAAQKLFALAKEEEEREDYGWILEKEIQTPIREAFESFHVTFTDNGISLPIKAVEVDPRLLEQLGKLSEREFEQERIKCEERIKRAKIYRIPKGAINGAAGSLRRLMEIPAVELDRQKLKELSKEIEKAFIKSGIRPLFRRDEKVLERPDLCTLFIEVRGNALIWPGLFIDIDKKLQMYGNFQGTCHKGEWE